VAAEAGLGLACHEANPRTEVNPVSAKKILMPVGDFTLNATFDSVRAEDYDALVIPGARAPEYIRIET